MRSRSPMPFIAAFAVAFFCFSVLSRGKMSLFRSGDTRVVQNFSSWHNCIATNVSAYADDPNGLWKNMWRGVKMCELLPETSGLPIGDFNNGDETKRHIVSKINTPSTIITLGIGHDTKAEESLLQKLPSDSEFFGADPMQEVNEKLYSKFGRYFHFAVGANPGITTASVLADNKYVFKSVVTIDLIYFLKYLVQKELIDDLWLDAEGAEYDLFPFFYRGGQLDQNGIVLCQFNIEIHLPGDKQKKLFHEFIFQLLKDRRYAFFRPVQGSHMRLYMLNYEDPTCVSKYLA